MPIGSDPLLIALEGTCRSRLFWHPEALMERIVLAICLGLQGEDALALIEWDEALFASERCEDERMLQRCLDLMGVLHPLDAQNLKEHLAKDSL